MLRIALLSLFAFTACSERVTPDGGSVADASIDVVDSGRPDAGIASGPVTGTRNDHHIWLDGRDTITSGVGMTTAGAWGADGGFVAATVTDIGNGNFIIDDAPPGDYFVHYGGVWIVTSARTLELDYLGAAFEPGLDASVTVSVTLGTTARPVKLAGASSAFNVGAASIALNDGGFVRAATLRGNPPSSGTKTWVWEVDDADLDGGELGVGRHTELGAWVELDETPQAGPHSLVTTAPVVWNAPFASGPVEAMRSAFSPPTNACIVSSNIVAIPPLADDDAANAVGQDLASRGNTVSAFPAQIDHRLTTQNPFPSSWRLQYWRAQWYSFEGVLGGIGQNSLDPAKPFPPDVGPVRDVLVDGQPAFTRTPAVVATPVIKWQPPARGVPNDYIVSIFMTNFQVSARPYPVGQVWTKNTEVRLPPGLVPPTGKLHVQIWARFQARSTPYPMFKSADFETASSFVAFPLTP